MTTPDTTTSKGMYLSIGLSIVLAIALFAAGITWQKNVQLSTEKSTAEAGWVAALHAESTAIAARSTLEARLVQVQETQGAAAAESARLVDQTSNQAGPCGADGFDACADVGLPADEAYHRMAGWKENEIGGPVIPPSADPSKRYQPLRGEASLVLKIPQAGVPYMLYTEVEDGGCDDSWEIYINGQGPIYTHYANPRTNLGLAHQVAVSGAYVTGDEVTVTFHNLASDECGLAAVFNVRLERNESTQ